MGKSKKKSGAGSELRELNLKTAEKWRQWLIKNYEITDSVWLLLHKNKDTDRNLSYEKALEEALCFGWIDSKPRKKDEDSYFVLFSKRNPKSNWSRKNRDTVKLLIKEGRMHKAGLEAVRIAKETGKWEALTDVQNSVIPDDLKQELDANPVAQENFNNFPPSSKRIILEWLLNAKMEATRKKEFRRLLSLQKKISEQTITDSPNKNEFINSLTYDSFVIQIFGLEMKMRNRLEKVLRIFSQAANNISWTISLSRKN